MSRGLTVSLAAVDVVCEHLGLDPTPTILGVPRVGTTMADRSRIRDAVLTDLADRNLAHGDEIDRKLARRLVLLCRAPLVVEAIAILHNGHRIRAQMSSNGRAAVLAVRDNQFLRLTAPRPTAAVPAIVNLIGPARPGPGHSITYPTEPTARRRTERMLTDPRVQTGTFTVVHRRQRETVRPALLWFDTDAGRYIGYTTPGPDDSTWTTYSPADNTRLAQHLTALVKE
jgi:hypothetical protein